MSWEILASDHTSDAALRVPSVDQTEFALRRIDALAELGFRGNFQTLGPAARIRALPSCTDSQLEILRFLNAGDQVNVLRQVQDSLCPVASGIQ